MRVWSAKLHKEFELNGKHETPYIGEYLHLNKFCGLYTCVFVKLSRIWPNSLLLCLHFHTSPHFDQFVLTVSTYLADLCISLDDDCLQSKHVVYYKKYKSEKYFNISLCDILPHDCCSVSSSLDMFL